jgi:broad specificity phosphatase PhoE
MRLTLALGFAVAATIAPPHTAHAQADRLVILVRHAEKAAEPRGDPDLSDAGQERAKALATALASAHVDAVIVTQYRRTHETAEHVLAARHLTPIVVKAGDDLASHVKAVADAVRAQPPGATILVVGHGNTVPAIIGALGGPKLPDLCDDEYATMFVLDLPASGRPRLVRSTYGAADPPGASSCAEHTMKMKG